MPRSSGYGLEGLAYDPGWVWVQGRADGSVHRYCPTTKGRLKFNGKWNGQDGQTLWACLRGGLVISWSRTSPYGHAAAQVPPRAGVLAHCTNGACAPPLIRRANAFYVAQEKHPKRIVRVPRGGGAWSTMIDGDTAYSGVGDLSAVYFVPSQLRLFVLSQVGTPVAGVLCAIPLSLVRLRLQCHAHVCRLCVICGMRMLARRETFEVGQVRWG